MSAMEENANTVKVFLGHSGTLTPMHMLARTKVMLLIFMLFFKKEKKMLLMNSL